MLSDVTLQLIRIQFSLCNDCIRSIVYFTELGFLKDKPDTLVFTKDVFGEFAVNSWCKLFGSRSEDTHWSKIVDIDEVKSLSESFNREAILEATGQNLKEWKIYHAQIKRCRDKYCAHFDTAEFAFVYPDLTPALNSVMKFRGWLDEILEMTIVNDQRITKVSVPNDIAIARFRCEASAFKNC